MWVWKGIWLFKTILYRLILISNKCEICHNCYEDQSMENDSYQLNEVYENAHVWEHHFASQAPFYKEKSILIQLVLIKIGLNINLPAFKVEILKNIVILLMY